jgi:hypothetical protein
MDTTGTAKVPGAPMAPGAPSAPLTDTTGYAKVDSAPKAPGERAILQLLYFFHGQWSQLLQNKRVFMWQEEERQRAQQR